AREPIDVLHEAKGALLSTSFSGDFHRLEERFFRLYQQDVSARDTPRPEARRLLEEALLCLPIYRLPPVSEDSPPQGPVLHVLAQTLQKARAHCGMTDSALPEFLYGLLRGPPATEEARAFAIGFAQLSAPLMAKGYEDCALYRWPMLMSTAEVGSAPGVFASSPSQVHHRLAARVHWPYSLLATSTHDTKQSEDVRARLHVLSEIPAAWRAWCRGHFFTDMWRSVAPMVDNKVRYQLLQTLVGAWPIDEGRAQRHMQKAVREAREHTSWSAPHLQYERAVVELVGTVYNNAELREAIAAWVDKLAPHAQRNALAELLLKLTAPGVPDIFQGTELWHPRLVDPDNRSDVDFRVRRAYLRRCRMFSAPEVMKQASVGLPKMWLIHRVLSFRRDHGPLFGPGADYSPLPTEGPRADQLFAFARGGGAMVIAVPRLWCASPPDDNQTTLRLPRGRYRNILDNGAECNDNVSLSWLFRHFPVALLWRCP
ncbi:MAG: malto-oligosyltrehalose synthase, partial [Myxococcota bacterium]